MNNQVSFLRRHPILKDIFSLIIFVFFVVIGTLFLNTYVIRSYNVVGASMENTLHGKDRLIVNRAAVSLSHFLGKPYVPKRGQIIVFLNGDASGPLTCGVETTIRDQYIIMNILKVFILMIKPENQILMDLKNKLLVKLT